MTVKTTEEAFGTTATVDPLIKTTEEAFGERPFGVIDLPQASMDPNEVADRAGKVWDKSVELGISPDDSKEYYDELQAIDKQKPMGFVEGLTQDALFKIPVTGAIIEAIDLVGLKLAAVRLNAPEFDWEREAQKRKQQLDWEYGKPRLVPTMSRQEYLDRRNAITAESVEQSDIGRVESYIEVLAEREERGYVWHGRIGSGISMLPAWMFEFALTGGLYQGAKAPVKSFVRKWAKSKLLAGTAGWATGSAVRTTVGMPQRVFRNSMKRHLDRGEGPFTAISKGWLETYVEVASEQAGDSLTWLAKGTISKLPFGSKFIGVLQREWLKISPNNTAAAFAKKMATKAGYSNLIAEMGEERLATVMHGLVKTETFGAPAGSDTLDVIMAGLQQDFEATNLLTETAVLSVPGAVKVSIAQLGRVVGAGGLEKAIETQIGVTPEVAKRAVEMANSEGIEKADQYLSAVKTLGEETAETALAEEKEVSPGVTPALQQAIAERRKEAEALRKPPKPAEAPIAPKAGEIVAPTELEQLASEVDKSDPKVLRIMEEFDKAVLVRDVKKMDSLLEEAYQLWQETGKNRGLVAIMNRAAANAIAEPPIDIAEAKPAAEELFGTRNQYKDLSQAEQMERVLTDKPAYLRDPSAVDVPTTEEMQTFAQKNNLVIGEKEGALVVAQNQEALDAVIAAKGGRELGLALGYQDIAPEAKPAVEGIVTEEAVKALPKEWLKDYEITQAEMGNIPYEPGDVVLQDTPTTPQSPLSPNTLLSEQVPPSKPPAKFTKQWYEDNRKRRKTLSDRFAKAGDIGKRAAKTIDKVIGTTSTRIENISPEVFRRERHYEFSQKMRVLDWGDRITPFLKGVNSMPKQDRNSLDLALKNGDRATIDNFIEQYGLATEYAEARTVFDEIFLMARKVGVDMDYRQDYWPRTLKDPVGFLRYFQKGDSWSIIEEALKRRAERGNRSIEELTDEEKAQVINTLMRGYRTQQISLSLPDAAKAREVDVVTADLNQFYDSPIKSAEQYIHQMANSIGQREFFGKEVQLVSSLRKLQSGRLTRLANYRKGKGLKEGTTQEAYNKRIAKAEEAYQATQERLERLTGGMPTESIGLYLAQLKREGLIKPEQEVELRDLLYGLFQPGHMSKGVSAIRTAGYIDLLNSPLQALTQLDEFAYSFYRSPIHSVPAAIRTAARKSKITPRDIGITSIGAEFEDISLRKALSLQLKATGFELVDRLNKENYINTVLGKYQAQARKKVVPTSLVNRLQRVFGDDYTEVLADLQKPIKSLDDVSENVRFLLFNELLDIQPLTPGEMPEAYNKSGNLRMAYMLRTFYIKRLDVFRRESFQKMAHANTFAEGFGNMVWLATAFSLWGVPGDFLKDYLRGKEFDLTDSVVDNLFKIAMLSKYQVSQLKTEGVGKTIGEAIFPATKLPDAVIRDVITIAKDRDRGFELWNSIPEVGWAYYWWRGEGAYKTGRRKRPLDISKIVDQRISEILDGDFISDTEKDVKDKLP